MTTLRHSARPVRAPADRRLEAPGVADTLRHLEHLERRGRGPDVLERLVRGWLRARPSDVDAREARRVVRWLGAHTAAAPRPLARRLEARAHTSVEHSPHPMRVRDDGWFARLGRIALASRVALAGIGFEPATAASPAPSVRPGVYALQLEAREVASGVAPDVAEVLRRLGAGRRLDRALCERLAPKLAAVGRAVALEDVVVHRDAAADALCRELRAEAFCVGRHVAFRAGRYRPDTADGLALIAHELTHVWQQARADFHATGLVRDPVLEHDADQVAARVSTVEPHRHAPLAPVRAPAAHALQGCDMARDLAARRRGTHPLGALRRPRLLRATRVDVLIGEARDILRDEGLQPVVTFVVGERIVAYDRGLRPLASWAITGEVPLAPGVWFDGGLGVAQWSTLTAQQVERLTGGRADDVWFVGPRPSRAADEPTPISDDDPR